MWGVESVANPRNGMTQYQFNIGYSFCRPAEKWRCDVTLALIFKRSAPEALRNFCFEYSGVEKMVYMAMPFGLPEDDDKKQRSAKQDTGGAYVGPFQIMNGLSGAHRPVADERLIGHVQYVREKIDNVMSRPESLSDDARYHLGGLQFSYRHTKP